MQVGSGIYLHPGPQDHAVFEHAKEARRSVVLPSALPRVPLDTL
jgi:hypothetical protein